MNRTDAPEDRNALDRDATEIDSASMEGEGGQADGSDEGGVRPLPFHRIAVGGQHVCAIRASNGLTYCFGANHDGQLGNGEMDDNGQFMTPVREGTGDFEGAYALGAGGTYTCAARSRMGEPDSISCWGFGYSGETGFGMGTLDRTAKTVTALGSTLGKILEIAGGDQNVCVRSESGVSCWGHNDEGEISASSAPAIFAPGLVQIAPPQRMVQRLALGFEFSLDILDDGSIQCWGASDALQCGVVGVDKCPSGINDTWCMASPKTVEGLRDAREIAAGPGHACAVVDGKVRCWGANFYGQAGATPTPNPCVDGQCPVGITEVTGLDNVERLALGATHSCALRAGEVWCWGFSSILGSTINFDPSPGPQPMPQPVVGELGDRLRGVVDISSGGEMTCALNVKDQVFCWGIGTATLFQVHATYVGWP